MYDNGRKKWYKQKVEEVESKLETSIENGLSEEQVRENKKNMGIMNYKQQKRKLYYKDFWTNLKIFQ